MRRLFTLVALCVVISISSVTTVDAQCVSLTTMGAASTQNFDTLSNTAGSTTNNLTITGWFMTETGGGARDNEQYAVDTGGSNTGDTYSYGSAAATDRALGGLQSGTLIPVIGACYTNNTGSTISSLAVAYTGEQWRIGNTAAARDDRLDFQYSTNATSLTTGTWTDENTLDFTNPIKTNASAGALDGNAAANRTAISSSVASVSIANGATFWIRWNDLNASGADDGLSIDDVSITPQSGPATPVLNVNDVAQAETNAGTTTFTFTASLTAPAGPGGVTFDIATADGTAQDDNPATEDNDYVAQSLTGQTIPAGSSTYAFNVAVNGDTATEPNETFFVNVTNITGANAGDTQGQGTINNDDVSLTPIHDIQGPGGSSPIVGASVTTTGVVTGVKSNGFFMQEPDATVDADPATSEGVFVFTNSAPPAAAVVGALVQVTATVVEFVPSQDLLQPPLTELSSPTVVQLSTGNPLPAAIPLTATFPDPAGPVDQLERLEGMRVSVASLTVSGPTLGNTNEPNATSTSTGVFFGTVTGVARPFREAGIQAPDPAPAGGGTIPPIPRWDANPELLRVDSDGLTGGTQIEVGTGAVVTGLVGPLDYGFRKYSIYPDPGASIGVTGGPTAIAVTAPAASEFTVAAYNIERFFDTVNDPGIGEPVLTTTAFNNRLAKASLGIRNYLRTPDIVGIVEVENLTTLQALATQISNDAVAASQADPEYDAFLVEGNDVGGIDVGFLVKTAVVSGATPRVEVVEVQQELDGTLFVNPDSSTETLNDRPPLRLKAVVHHSNGASYPVTVIVNHLRSLNGVNDEGAGSNGWPTGGARVRAKRQMQAEDLANLVQARQIADATENIVLVGDFNAFEFNDGFGDSMGVIEGAPVPDNETAVAGDGVDLVNPDFDNLFDTVSATERYSFVFDGSAQSLDHVLVNAPMIASTLARREEHPRINADFPDSARNDTVNVPRLADHDPVVSYYQVAAFATAGVSITKTDSPDPVNAGANLAWTVTVTNAGPDPADNVEWTDTLPTGTTFVSLSSPGGWSCTTPAVGAGGAISCSIASLSVTSAAFTLTALVEPSVVNGTVISNTAAVTSDTADSNTGDNSATADTTVVAAADLSVTKVDTPDPVVAGANITYTITVSNAGPTNAASASLSDTLPTGTTFVSLSSPGGWSCTTPAVGAGGTVSCSNTSLVAGSSVFTLVVAVDGAVASGTVLSNTATVSSATSDPNSGNENATADTTVTASADLSVTKVDTPDPVDAGSNITYTITATNAGPSNAATVSLDDTLPAGTTFVSLTSPGGWSCSTPSVGAGGAVSCTNASLGVSSAVFTLTVKVDGSVAAGTVITNTAAVSSTTTDPNTGNESASADTTVTTIDLTIDDITVFEGNAGQTAANFTVSLARAAGATVTVNFATANDSALAGSDYTLNSGMLTFVPGDMSETITVLVTGDTTDEPNETYFVNLSGVTGPANLVDVQGLGTITDDDGIPTVSIANAGALEGSGGATTPMTFTVSLSNPSDSTVTVEAGTAEGTAAPGSDYTTTAQTITFLPGSVSQGFTVPVLDDGELESGESFFVNLSAPVNATLGDGQAIGTITDDDETVNPPDPVIVSNCLPVVGGPCVLTVESLSGASQRYWYYTWYIDGVPAGTLPTLQPEFSAPGSYVIVVEVVDRDGQTGSATITITIPEPCPTGRLCMHDGRFEISLVASDPRTGGVDVGVPLRENDQFGYFALPGLTGSTENPEVFVKVLDGTAVNGFFWTFYGGLTDLEYVITVVDHEAGTTKTYSKPGGSSAGGFDVGSGVTPEECEGEVDGTPGPPEILTGCDEGTDRLCLLGERFKITLIARDQRTGAVSDGVSIPENDTFGYFSLPGLTGDATNPEVFVKVLDGTPINGHHWVFYAGLTDLEYTITVIDVTTGAVKRYTKPASSACGGFDTNGL